MKRALGALLSFQGTFRRYLCSISNDTTMFGLFKPKSELEKLQKQYEKLLKESHQLSTSDRAASDLKQAEAAEVLKKMDALEEK